MTNEEAKHKMDFLKKAYQKLIDEKVDSGKLVGDGVMGEWKAETPIDEAYKSMIEALDMAIKALEQTRWIPVSERLPEESGRYLVTYERYSQFYTDVAMFDINQKGNHGFFPIFYIVAWAYLPAPYQPPKMMCEED